MENLDNFGGKEDHSNIQISAEPGIKQRPGAWQAVAQTTPRPAAVVAFIAIFFSNVLISCHA